MKILIAEDNIINQKLLINILKKNNWETVTAKNGIEALNIYQNEKPDIILMDVQMPQLNGLETTTKIRELEKSEKIHTPIIALSGYTSKSEIKEMLDSGMDECLSKPIDFNELINKISKLFENEKSKNINC